MLDNYEFGLTGIKANFCALLQFILVNKVSSVNFCKVIQHSLSFDAYNLCIKSRYH